MRKDFWLATSILAGTIIGAGIFSLPFVFSRLGLLTGFFYLIAFTAVYFVIHLIYAKVLVIEQSEHQFFYLAKKYFPPALAGFASFVILIELIFVLAVYLILSPTFFQIAFGDLGGGSFLGLIVFWLFSSFFIFMKIRGLSIAEFLGTMSIVVIVGIIFFAGAGRPFPTFTTGINSMSIFLLPFGPLLFALSGRPAVHKVVEVWKKSGAAFSLKNAIAWGSIIPAILYFIFVVGILRLNPNVTPEALDSLKVLPPVFFQVLGWLGLIALWTSYFMIGANIKDILELDLKYPKWISASLTLLAPLALYFLGFRDFLQTLSFTGGVFLALEGFFVIKLWQKTLLPDKLRSSYWAATILASPFAAAIIYEIYTILK